MHRITSAKTSYPSTQFLTKPTNCTCRHHRLGIFTTSPRALFPSTGTAIAHPNPPWISSPPGMGRINSLRSLEYLSTEQQAQGISDDMYIYRHRCEGSVDIHDIFVKKSTFRVLLSCVGAIIPLAIVCCILWSKESLYLGSLWSISFAGIISKCLRHNPVKKESVVIMPAFGVQLEQHFWSGRVHRKFVPIGKILKPVLNEHVTPVTCYWSMSLLLRDEYELMVVFKRLYPPVKMLVPIWKALFALANSDGTNTSIVCQPFDSHGGGVLPESSM